MNIDQTMPALTALLPVRLETRFIEPDASGSPWRLRLRIIPETISLDSHDRAVAPSEEQALTAFWGCLGITPDPHDPVGSAASARGKPGFADAFARLAAQVGAGRAQWLVRAVADPEAVTRQGVGVVRAFPPEILVWVLWEDADDAEVLVTIPVDVAALEAQPTETPPRWVVDWDAACHIGLAVEVDLPYDPALIRVLGVCGTRTEADGVLSTLLDGHAAAGTLSLAGPGVATTGVHGGPTLAARTDAAAWFDTPGAPPALAARTLQALLGAADTLGPVPAEGTDEADRDLVRLTFPALFGYGLTEVLGTVDRLELAPLWAWATTWLRPRGSYATVVVDGTAYGVLPVVDPGRIVAGEGLRHLEPMLAPLSAALRAWADAAAADPGVVGGGVADVVRTLRRGPVPGAVASSRLIRSELLATLTNKPVEPVILSWDAEHARTLGVLRAGGPGGHRGLRYDALQPAVTTLAIPLIVSATPTPDEAAERLTRLLEDWREVYLAGWPIDFGAGEVACLYLHREWDAPSNVYLDQPERPDSLLVRLVQRTFALAGGALDLWRQELGAQPVVTEPPPVLAEHLDRVAAGGSTILRDHLRALAEMMVQTGPRADWVSSDPRCQQLADELTWLARAGLEVLRDRIWDATHDPASHRELHRALSCLIEAAAGRWDAWWDAVGAHHVADVVTATGPPTAGVYGWVDRPCRGTPGPGPGGLVMAPSTAQAATAAALRDRAVHEPEQRWDLRLDSATIGPARTLLARIGDGWHPAEVVGRLLEDAVCQGAAQEGVTLGAADLQPLREAYPLRTGQGHFGCCHGLHVLDSDALPVLDRAPQALAAAVEEVRAVLASASDLVLAEALHGVLAGRPERAAVATEFLAGQGAPGPLQVLDPLHTARTVRTLVLAALPAVPPSPDGGALGAAPGFDAALRASIAAPWTVVLPGGQTVPLEHLGLAPVHATVLDDAALTRVAALHLAREGNPVDLAPESGGEVVGGSAARAFAAACAGRAPHPTELQPTTGPPGEAVANALLADAVDAWGAQLEALAAAASKVVEGIATDVAAAHVAWETEADRLRALVVDGAPPPADVTAEVTDTLAQRWFDLAPWGFAPPPGTHHLYSNDADLREAAVVGSIAGLSRAAGELAARVVTARSGAGGAAELATLAAGAPLPIGTRAPLSLLGEELTPVTGTPTETDWLPRMAGLRPAVHRLVNGRGGASCSAVAPDDPWRILALSQTGPEEPVEPRLTVVLDAAPPGEDREWVVLDAFIERVPHVEQQLGLAFDAATPSASPPAAVLLVPGDDLDPGLVREALPAAVLLARTLAHARMASTATLSEAGLGALTAACVLPQDGDTGAPVGDEHILPDYDLPVALLPRTTHQDTDDLVAAVTADAAWMVGLQWRIGEHLGENAASPVTVSLEVTTEPLAEPLLATRTGESVVEDAGWQPDRLEHRTDWADVTVRQHDAGPLDWWALQRKEPGAQTVPETRAAHPTRLEWPGQPRRSYWEVEDAEGNPVSHPVDRAHPATLHLVDLVNRLGDDWYLLPVTGRAGSFLRVRSATLTDGTGGVWTLATDPGWSLFAVAGDSPGPDGHRALPVVLGGGALEAEPFEEVALAVDEDANLLWAALLHGPRLGTPADAGPLPVTAAARSLHGERHDVRWELGGTPPVARVPYLYGGSVQPGEYGHGRDLFIQARLRDPRTGQLSDQPLISMLPAPEDGSPHTLRPLAVPASGVRLTRRLVLARDISGHPVVWERTERRPLDVAVDVDLSWDTLTDLPPA